MKKIITSFIVLILTVFIYQASYAEDASVGFNFSGDSKVTKGTNTVSYTISLGDFTGIAENAMMGYEAVLEYDNNVFGSVSIEGLNDWTAQYTESTKRLIGETRTKAEANKAIAKITLILKDDAPVGNTTVKLTNVLLTVNDTQDFKYTKEATLEIEAKAEESKNDAQNTNVENTNTDTNQSEQQNENKNQANNSTGNSALSNNTSNEFKNLTKNETSNNSKAASVLPKTGTERIALAVFMILIIGIGCLIRYKSIQTK